MISKKQKRNRLIFKIISILIFTICLNCFIYDFIFYFLFNMHNYKIVNISIILYIISILNFIVIKIVKIK